MPGTYDAETPTGHTYRVEKSDNDWRVILLGPRGGREVLGEPTRIKWLGQCRAEYHYLHVLGAKTESAKPATPPQDKSANLKARPQAAAPRPTTPKPTPTAAASSRRATAEKSASRRHRRPTAAAAKPAAAAGSPLPAETLAWTVSQKRGREFHVAEHKDGLFKILEVKGAEGFALFDEKSDGVVHEIRCGSLEACKQAAASRYMDSAPKANKPGKRAAPAKTTTASDGEDAKAKPATAKSKTEPAKASPPAGESPVDGACGCQHTEEATPPPPKEAPKAEPKPASKDRDTKILAGLQSALRKMKPPTAAET
jgi:hypothetical protein